MPAPPQVPEDHLKTSVFPAFNANYKNRRRTFRCCRNCRSKRARCILSGNYEKYGCDDCRSRKLHCDLINSPSLNAIPPSVESSVLSNELKKPVSAEFDLTSSFGWYSFSSTQTSLPSTGKHDGKRLPGLMSRGLNDPKHNFSPSKKLPPSPATLTLENVDEMIHDIDWRLLKHIFNFNTSIKETSIYYAKSLSRKETHDTKRVSLTEVLSRKHRNKQRFLSSRNLPHLKFLLSINAFTLNTPGFFEVTELDLFELYQIYFYKVNSIFPIVHEQEFWELYKRNKIPNIMVYAIVIIAARDDLSFSILERSFRSSGFSFIENQNRLIYELETKIRQLLLFLPELEDTEKLTRLTTQLLLSLNFTFNKFGNEQSSHDLFDCVSYAFSLLFHHKFFHDRLIKEGAEEMSIYLQNLWWVLFIFDRFNALLNGKAVVIKRSDFNISRPERLPHLNRIVVLAYALEDTLIAAFRPPRIIKGKDTVILETLPGDPVFKSSEYLKETEKNPAQSEKLKAVFHVPNCQLAAENGHLPGLSVNTYRERHVVFFEEIIRSHLGLILRTGHLKFLKSCDEIDEPSLKFSQSFLELLAMLKNGQGYRLVMPIPLIPLIMLVGLSVPLTSRMRMTARLRGISSSRKDIHKLTRIGDLCDQYITEFDYLAQSWWFVHEVMESIEIFNTRAKTTQPTQELVIEQKKSSSESQKAARAKLSIHSLVSPELPGIPVHLSMTSPEFYDEVIGDNEVVEELRPNNEPETDSGGYLKVLLYSPSMSQTIGGTDGEPVLKNPSPAGSAPSKDATPSGNLFQFVNENTAWDREFLADQFDDETSFFPNILHYFSEQPTLM